MREDERGRTQEGNGKGVKLGERRNEKKIMKKGEGGGTERKNETVRKRKRGTEDRETIKAKEGKE